MWPIVYQQFAPTFDIFRNVHGSVVVATIIVQFIVVIFVVSIITRARKWNAHSSSRIDLGRLTPRKLEDGKGKPDPTASEKSTLLPDASVPPPYESDVTIYQRQCPNFGIVSTPHRQSYAPPARTPAPADDEPTEMIKEPETRPISQEQLVKGNAHSRQAPWKRRLRALLSSPTDFSCLTLRKAQDRKYRPGPTVSEKSTPRTVAPIPRPHDKSNVTTYQQRQCPNLGTISGPHCQSHAPPARTLAQAPSAANDEPTEMIKEPETRPISQEQLVAEVKGIYAGLVMVEGKCIEAVSKLINNQSSQTGAPTKLNNDQWQALIGLHRTLLNEHLDFLYASQHPSASPALRRLAAKYAMPARMWRHGVHSFLELLRRHLPASLDHMLTFIYMAYSMLALLYETVPAFEDTWIECLGDLGRYRMAIEDDDMRDREVWTAVSRHWYSRASDKAPTTGRLYHHLAILAQRNAQQQLYYYTKSLCVEMPFPSARESIMTLFEPIMSHTSNQQQIRLPPAELYYVRTHGILFSGKQEEELEPSMGRFLELLDHHIGRSTHRWIAPGYHIGISNICALIGYGDETNPIAQALKVTRPSDESSDQPMPDSETPAPLPSVSAGKQFPSTRKLFMDTYNVVCRRIDDHNILAFVHVTLVLIHHLTFFPEAMGHVAPHFPWKLTAVMLNTLIGSSSSRNVSRALTRFLESGELFPGWKEKQEERQNNAEGAEPGEPRPGAPKKRPLPEDFALRGFPFVENYFPDGWFVTEENIDDDAKSFELLSMIEERKERVVWLGFRIADKDGKWLQFDKENRRFGVHPDYEVELDLEMPMPATPEKGWTVVSFLMRWLWRE